MNIFCRDYLGVAFSNVLCQGLGMSDMRRTWDQRPVSSYKMLQMRSS